ncbi:MAG: hypothetical protein AB4426_20900 [Xenococcaceae cyanobacterium]
MKPIIPHPGWPSQLILSHPRRPELIATTKYWSILEQFPRKNSRQCFQNGHIQSLGEYKNMAFEALPDPP